MEALFYGAICAGWGYLCLHTLQLSPVACVVGLAALVALRQYLMTNTLFEHFQHEAKKQHPCDGELHRMLSGFEGVAVANRTWAGRSANGNKDKELIFPAAPAGHRDKNVSVCAIMHVSGAAAPPTPASLAKAAKCLSMRFPELRANIAVTPNAPVPGTAHFVPLGRERVLGQMDFTRVAKVLAVKDDEAWKEVCSREVLRGFPNDDLPLFKVKALTFPNKEGKWHLLITYLHSVSDGQGAKILTSLLLQYLRDDTSPHDIVSDAPGMTCAERAFGTPSVPWWLRLLSKPLDPVLQFVEHSLHVSNTGLRVDKSVGVHQGVTAHVFGQGDKASFAAMRARCKQEGVTVGAAMGALQLFALYRELEKEDRATKRMQNHQPRTEFFIPLAFAVDMRRRLRSGKDWKDTLGNFIAMQIHELSVKRDITFWELAKTVHGSTDYLVRSWLWSRILPTAWVITEAVESWPDKMLKMAQSDGGLVSGAYLSNIGRYAPTGHEGVTVDALYFMQGMQPVYMHSGLFTATAGGVPSFIWQYTVPHTPHKGARELMDVMVATAAECARYGPENTLDKHLRDSL